MILKESHLPLVGGVVVRSASSLLRKVEVMEQIETTIELPL